MYLRQTEIFATNCRAQHVSGHSIYCNDLNVGLQLRAPALQIRATCLRFALLCCVLHVLVHAITQDVQRFFFPSPWGISPLGAAGAAIHHSTSGLQSFKWNGRAGEGMTSSFHWDSLPKWIWQSPALLILQQGLSFVQAAARRGRGSLKFWLMEGSPPAPSRTYFKGGDWEMLNCPESGNYTTN